MSPKSKKKRKSAVEEDQQKINELESKLQEEKEKAESYLNQLKYARADLENLRKQMQRRIDESVERGNQRLFMKFLPIFEELNLAFNAASANEIENNAVLKGLEMVKKKLEKLFDSEGVSTIDAVGKTFDPNLHEAVLEEETNDHPGGTILEEIRNGYLYKGKLLRASMVKVARNLGSREIKIGEQNERQG